MVNLAALAPVSSSHAFFPTHGFDLANLEGSSLTGALAPAAMTSFGAADSAAETVAAAARAEQAETGEPAPEAPVAASEHVATVDEGRPPISDNQQAVDYHRQQRNLARMELVFQLFNIGDAVTTISCVERRTCKETNPLYGGKHPSWGRVAGIKAGVGLMHYLAYRTLSKSNPRLAKIFEISTIAIQGSVVLWNIAVTLK